MRRPGRNRSAKFKAKAAVAALKGDKTMAELATQFDVHANQNTDWKNQLLKQSEDVFMTKSEKQATQTGPTIQELQAKIGELIMENDFWIARSVGWTARAESDDRSRPRAFGFSTSASARALPLQRVLPTCADLG